MNIMLIFLTFSLKCVCCRDFYMGMFKRNDFLVAQDSIYKGAMPHRYTYAKYGRIFKCPITYFRMVDRIGMGQGPTAEVVRGGLMKKYIVVRIRSPYNLPISVSIYVGCENKDKSPRWKRPSPPTPVTEEVVTHATETGASDKDGGAVGDEVGAASGNGTASGGGAEPDGDSSKSSGSTKSSDDSESSGSTKSSDDSEVSTEPSTGPSTEPSTENPDVKNDDRRF